jgi:hypothetical protein
MRESTRMCAALSAASEDQIVFALLVSLCAKQISFPAGATVISR